MGNERMERKITIEEHVLYKEDYQMKMLKANSPEGFLKVAGRGMNGSSYYDYDVSGKISMQAMYTRAKLKAEDIRQFMYQFGNVLRETGKYLLDILYGMEFSRKYDENLALNNKYEKSGKKLLW